MKLRGKIEDRVLTLLQIKHRDNELITGNFLLIIIPSLTSSKFLIHYTQHNY